MIIILGIERINHELISRIFKDGEDVCAIVVERKPVEPVLDVKALEHLIEPFPVELPKNYKPFYDKFIKKKK